MKKRTDWSERLMAYVESQRNTPFQWGTHDCCMFACSCIEAMTGEDPAAGFRGRYNSKATAFKIMKELYGTGLEKIVEAIAANSGVPEVDIRFHQRGDVVLARDKNGAPAMGICLGPHVAIVGDIGIALRNSADIERAWRIA